MNHPRIFAVLTFLLVGASVLVILVFKFFGGDWNKALSQGFIPTPKAATATETPQSSTSPDSPEEAPGSETPPPPSDETDAAPQNEAPMPSPEQEMSLITPGSRSADLKSTLADRIPRIREIPWGRSAAESAYRSAAGYACSLLPPDVPVTPSEQGGNKQRVMALTIGLQVDPAARRELPSLSKSQIEKYLSDHMLGIQPVIRTSDNGAEFVGAVHGAFFSRFSPTFTMTSEPMIAEAMNQFRLLGAYVDPNRSESEQAARTLVMIFKYTRDDPQLRRSISEYELLFLHLIPKPGGYQLTAFGTSDGRQVLQELIPPGRSFGRQTATVHGNVRFASYTAMGLYPANPIVTAVRNSYRSSLPMPEVLTRLRGTFDQPAVTLTELLEGIHQQSVASSVPVR